MEPERGPKKSFGGLLPLGLYEVPRLPSLPWVRQVGLVPCLALCLTPINGLKDRLSGLRLHVVTTKALYMPRLETAGGSVV
jgi:hypothetical protein